jgi:tripartite-type tricarboxylate transporter receptor subunit TctC
MRRRAQAPAAINREDDMKRMLFVVAAALIAVWGAGARAAEAFPSKPVRYIVPFPPGGISDMMARIVAQQTSATFKQSVVVDNRPGGNAMIGAVLAAKAPADGYTWLSITITHAINVTLFPDSPYNLLKDFQAVSVLASLPLVVVVNANLPVKSLAELTALGKTRTLNGGSSGNGTPQHLAFELYRQLAGIKGQHIPFKGGAPSVISLLGGEIDLLITGVPETIMHIKSGKLRALAIASQSRHALIADIPTTAEAGLPAQTITSWTALMVPAGIPRPVLNTINKAVVDALKQPEMTQKIREQAFEVVADAPDAAQAFIASEAERWGKLVREANLKPD